MFQIPSNKVSSPEDRATLWTWLTFSYVQPIMDLAVQRSRTRISMESGKLTPNLLNGPVGTRTSTSANAAPLHEDLHLPPSLSISTPSGETRTLDDEVLSDSMEETLASAQKRTLTDDDVWSLPPTFLHRNLFRKYLARRVR